MADQVQIVCFATSVARPGFLELLQEERWKNDLGGLPIEYLYKMNHQTVDEG